jgi:CheY-like chemotaxis protein
MTANAFASDQGACLDAGMNAFIAKPINAEKLHEILNRVMFGPAIREEHPSRTEAPSFSRAPLEALLEQLDASTVEDILQCFGTEVPALLERLERRLAEGTATEAEVSLLSLRRVLGNLGFVAAADYCREQVEALAAGNCPDADGVGALRQLVEAGLRTCRTILAQNKRAEPRLASAA